MEPSKKAKAKSARKSFPADFFGVSGSIVWIAKIAARLCSMSLLLGCGGRLVKLGSETWPSSGIIGKEKKVGGRRREEEREKRLAPPPVLLLWGQRVLHPLGFGAGFEHEQK